MSENPYAPPQAPVADANDPEQPKQRPKQVMWAIYLAVASYLFGVLTIALNWSYYMSVQSVVSLAIGQAVAIALIVWLYWKVYQGRNWARIVLLVFAILGLVAIPFTFKLLLTAPMIVKVQSHAGWVIGLIIVYLLFLSPGKEWFRKPGEGPKPTGGYEKRK